MFAGPRFREGLRPPRFRGAGVLPLCAAVLCGGTPWVETFGVPPVIKRKKGHLVDALALRGDEGRGTLR